MADIVNFLGQAAKFGLEQNGYGKYGEYVDEGVRIFKGLALPVSPLDSSDMSIANMMYDVKIESALNKLDDVLREKKTNEILNILRIHSSQIEVLFESDKLILNLLNAVNDARHDADTSLAGMGASTLKGLSPALWAIPGINVMFGTAAFAGGLLLDYYAASSTSGRIKKSLGDARLLFFENSAIIASKERMDSIWKNMDDDVEVANSMQNWFVKKEDEIFNSESEMLRSSREDEIFNGFTFFCCYNIEDKIMMKDRMGVILPIVTRNRKRICILVFDFRDKVVEHDFAIPFSSGFSKSVEYLKRKMLRGMSSKIKIKITSQTPFMRDHGNIEESVFNIIEVFKDLCSSDSIDASRYVHAFLQSGSPERAIVKA